MASEGIPTVIAILKGQVWVDRHAKIVGASQVVKAGSDEASEIPASGTTFVG